MDLSLCETFNKLNIGDQYRYYSVYGRYEPVIINDWQIKQTNLTTDTQRDIIATIPTTTTTTTTTNDTPNKTNKLYNGYTINCNTKVDNSKKSSDKTTQTLNQKHAQAASGYKKLGNLNKEEIKTMFFGVNGVDPNDNEITSIDEIDESQVNISEDIYNYQIDRVRMSQKQENNDEKAQEKEIEKWLWYGTNVQDIDKILANGFNRNDSTMIAYGIVRFSTETAII